MEHADRIERQGAERGRALDARLRDIRSREAAVASKCAISGLRFPVHISRWRGVSYVLQWWRHIACTVYLIMTCPQRTPAGLRGAVATEQCPCMSSPAAWRLLQKRTTMLAPQLTDTGARTEDDSQRHRSRQRSSAGRWRHGMPFLRPRRAPPTPGRWRRRSSVSARSWRGSRKQRTPGEVLLAVRSLFYSTSQMELDRTSMTKCQCQSR
jgi:hypothetical protein